MRRQLVVPIVLLLLVVIAGGAWRAAVALGTPPSPVVSDVRGRPPPTPPPPPTRVPVIDGATEDEPGNHEISDGAASGWTWEAGPSAAVVPTPPGDGPALAVLERALPRLHPLYPRDDLDRRYQDLVYDRLFRADAAGAIGSDLVARAEVQPRSVRVTLREGIRFHGRHALTARDVCQTVRILLDPTLASPVGARYRGALRGCDTHADGTATVHLRQAEGDPRARLDFVVMPASLTRADLLPDAAAPPGTGPMQADRAGRTFVAFDNPHRRAGVYRLTVAAMGDTDVAEALRTGAAQVAVDVRDLAPPDGVTVVPAAAPRRALVVAIEAGSSWADPEIRSALDQALDRAAVADAAGRSDLVHPGWPAMDVVPARFDPHAARAQLAGRTLRLAAPSEERQVADAVAAALRSVGVAVDQVAAPPGGEAAEGADARLVAWTVEPGEDLEPEPAVVLWSEDAAVALADHVRVPVLLRAEALFSPVEQWRLVPRASAQ